MRKSIGIIGAGNMGQVLAGGIAGAGIPGKELANSCMMSDVNSEKLSCVVEKLSSKGVNITGAKDNKELAGWADTIILAVKPNTVSSVLKEIKLVVDSSKLIISIAAGVKISGIENCFSEKVPVIRAMPNTPAIIGEGATAIAGGKFADAEHIEKARSIFSSAGIVVVVEEPMMDAVTAVSGSGPAYLFLLAEMMEEAGGKLGLPQEKIRKLVRQTLLGSVRMLLESGFEPAILREKVTSPGGTTSAALNCLREKGFREIFIEAVQEACRRSEELSRE